MRGRPGPGQGKLPGGVVAYYGECVPCERRDKDVALVKAAGSNVVHIAKSTWSPLKPQVGAFVPGLRTAD